MLGIKHKGRIIYVAGWMVVAFTSGAATHALYAGYQMGLG